MFLLKTSPRTKVLPFILTGLLPSSRVAGTNRRKKNPPGGWVMVYNSYFSIISLRGYWWNFTLSPSVYFLEISGLISLSYPRRSNAICEYVSRNVPQSSQMANSACSHHLRYGLPSFGDGSSMRYIARSWMIIGVWSR